MTLPPVSTLRPQQPGLPSFKSVCSLLVDRTHRRLVHCYTEMHTASDNAQSGVEKESRKETIPHHAASSRLSLVWQKKADKKRYHTKKNKTPPMDTHPASTTIDDPEPAAVAVSQRDITALTDQPEPNFAPPATTLMDRSVPSFSPSADIQMTSPAPSPAVPPSSPPPPSAPQQDFTTVQKKKKPKKQHLHDTSYRRKKNPASSCGPNRCPSSRT